MDNSISNTNGVTKDNTSDKVTIKVKVAGEDYHNLVIDWSDGNGANIVQQVMDQLSSITGIPANLITRLTIKKPETGAYFHITPYRGADDVDIFTKENCSAKLNDGDCFVIWKQLLFRVRDRRSHSQEMDFRLKIEFSISCYSRALFSDDECTHHYCLYTNNRAYLNRQIAIATNSELIRKCNEIYTYHDSDMMSLLIRIGTFCRDLGIREFIRDSHRSCSSLNPRNDVLFDDNYLRTHG